MQDHLIFLRSALQYSRFSNQFLQVRKCGPMCGEQLKWIPDLERRTMWRPPKEVFVEHSDGGDVAYRIKEPIRYSCVPRAP